MRGYALEGRIALVTGAGSGIGRATALSFAREGAKLFLTDMSESAVLETQSLVASAGVEVSWAAADLTDAGSAAAIVEQAAAEFGGLDCAFNCAGISAASVGAGGIGLGLLQDEAWRRLIDVNLTSVWSCMKQQLIQMERTGGGSIVNASSIAGLVGLPGSNAYVAAKHGVIGLTRSAALDYAGKGIRINAVCPGYIDTAMAAEALARRGAQILNSSPLARLGRPEEIAEAVVWLSSPRASFVTGAALAVDGGYSAA